MAPHLRLAGSCDISCHKAATPACSDDKPGHDVGIVTLHAAGRADPARGSEMTVLRPG
jgi:hypothetical protein